MRNSTKITSLLLLFLATHSTFAFVDSTVHGFLTKLNSGTGKPMEQMSPADARNVLINAQKSVTTDISGIDVEL